MPITTAMCNSFKLEALQGVHEASDVYKVALYTSAATLNKSTTIYSTTNEVAATGGYVAGGFVLDSPAFSLDGDVAIIDWADEVIGSATITARGALIYNSSQGNKAVAAYDFGGDVTSTAGNFTIQMPAATAAAAVVRIA